MTRIEYEIFREDLIEFRLPVWDMLWQTEREAIAVHSQRSLTAALVVMVLVGDDQFKFRHGAVKSRKQ